MRAVAATAKRLFFVVSVSAAMGAAGLPPWAHAQGEQDAQQKRMIEQVNKRQEQLRAQEQKEFEEYWARTMPRVTAPAGPSAWLEKERSFLVELLTLAKPQVLVVPPTVPDDAAGIDITARITMARQIAAIVEAEVGAVPDPALVYRALGEPRSVTVDEIRRRFGQFPVTTTAQWLIVGSATHDGAGKMRVTFTKLPFQKPAGAETAVAAFEKEGIEIRDDRPPELQFAEFAAAAARSLGYAGVPRALKPMRAAGLALPKSPLEASPEEGTLGGVWMQQLIGVLYAPYFNALPRPRERAFERTLAALIDTPRAAPDRAVLLARALAYLDRRQAALKVLAEGQGTAEEKALAAYLNSDLPGLKAAVAQLKRPAARLISQLELLALQHAAGMLLHDDLRSAVESLAAQIPPRWQPAAAFYVLGLNLWTSPEPSSVKAVLDREFPVPGYSAQDLLRGKAALGTTSFDERTSAQLALSPLVHARKWRAMNMSELCCRAGAATWGEFRREDYLDLLEADADRLAMARLDFLSRIQGLPDETVRLADLYDRVLFAGGHPGVVHERIMVALEGYRKVPPEQRQRVGSEAFENARKLLSWETSQSGPLGNARAARDGFSAAFVATLGTPPRMGKLLPPPPLELDAPMRSLWARSLGSIGSSLPDRIELEMRASRWACESTILLFSVCQAYLDKLKDANRNAELDAAIELLVTPRFKGMPGRYALLAARKEEGGDLESARHLLTEAVRLPNAPTSAYASLGNLLLHEGKFADAAKAYMSYPALKSAQSDTVALSNYAAAAGFGLAMRGASTEAHPLLELAAANRDGSYASLRSAAQVQLDAQQFDASLSLQQQAYQRYHLPETAARIASMLFALGQQDDAWSALRSVVPEARAFAPYRAAALGMRMLAYDSDAMLTWRAEVSQRSTPARGEADWKTVDFLTAALFQAACMDRDAAGLDAVFESKGELLMMRSPASQAKPGQPNYAGMVSNVPSKFIRAYLAYLKGDHEHAVEAWATIVKEFDVWALPPRVADASDTFWAGMPYFAFSLAKAGKLEEARQLPKRLTADGRPAGSAKPLPAPAQPMPAFEKRLIAGIAAAFAGEHEAAQRFLREALGTMPGPGARMLPPEYAFVEILESLTKETGVAAYRDMALRFARGYQRYEPWAGWAYAFDAANSPAGEGQVRSAALALKFDPKSARLEKLDPKLMEQAREWLRTNDPFKNPPPRINRTKA